MFVEEVVNLVLIRSTVHSESAGRERPVQHQTVYQSQAVARQLDTCQRVVQVSYWLEGVVVCVSSCEVRCEAMELVQKILG